jgi:hypothetical protein
MIYSYMSYLLLTAHMGAKALLSPVKEKTFKVCHQRTTPIH